MDNKSGQAMYPELCRPCTLSIVYRLRHGQNRTVEEAKSERSRALSLEPPMPRGNSLSSTTTTTPKNKSFKCAVPTCYKVERSTAYASLCTSCAVSWGKARKRGETDQTKWMARRVQYMY